ncbi:predicted protein [Uncinocarpus reesii 1704]|uniref:Potassium channel domain-containing protein n=1 Tax=Uncinocarpus reesii (strain UAMH 1704) TaxID=336963 RepID=C4JXU9_UNCRE|nr:uncharacterized protein UREG_07887 [Uncinocarpus reesii 1704]EEP83022.1 predicted protein [Uncinocarpus reesii 1704]
MAKRVPFSIAQPITVGGWYISSVLLICLTAVFPRRTDMHNRQVTQAYYYAIMAAALYFFISSLMLVTIYGAQTRRYSREFNLTTSQRSLMLQSIIYMLYLLLGALVYAHIEGWAYLDAVYWADFTILTDGIGNLAPTTHLGRGLLFPYAVGGILTLALLIKSIRSLMIERGKHKIIARTTEKIRASVAKRVRSGTTGRWSLLPWAPQSLEASEDQRKKEEFYLMRRIHLTAAFYTRWYSLLSSLFAWMCLWFLGALAFFLSQRQTQWTYFQSLYFAYTSLLTIGYGDFAPGATWSRPFFVLWSLLAIPTTTILFSAFGDTLARIFDDTAIYIGELTILPGEVNLKRRFWEPFHHIIQNIRHPLHQILSQPPETQASRATASYYARRLAELEEDPNNIQHRYRRQYLLSREMRKVHPEIGRSPPKRYTYEEWLFYLQLVDRLKFCCSLINLPPEETEEFGARRVGLWACKPQLLRWSWIGIHTPLIGEKDEAEWLFDALSSSLEMELKIHRETMEAVLPTFAARRYAHLIPNAQRMQRSLPVLGRAESETVSAALVGLVVLAIVMVLGLFIGLYFIRRCQNHRGHSMSTAKIKKSHGTRPMTLNRYENPDLPLLHSSNAQRRPSGPFPPETPRPNPFSLPSEVAHDTITVPPPVPSPRFNRENLDLDVVTLSQESADGTAYHSFGLDARSSVSSIVEKYRQMSEGTFCDSESSTETARPRRQKPTVSCQYRSSDASQMRFTKPNHNHEHLTSGPHAYSPTVRDDNKNTSDFSQSRPLYRSHREGSGSLDRPTGFSSHPSRGQAFRSQNSVQILQEQDKGKSPLHQDLEVPPLLIRKMLSAPGVNPSEQLLQASSSSLTASGRPERIGGYGGFSQAEIQTEQRLSTWKSLDHFTSIPRSSLDEDYYSGRRYPQGLPTASADRPLQGSTTSPHLNPHINASEGQNGGRNVIRFPLQTTSMVSDQVSMTPKGLNDIAPGQQVEFRDLPNSSYPSIHDQAGIHTESVYLGLAPPRESASFEWEARKKHPGQNDPCEHKTQNAQATMLSSNTERSDDLCSDGRIARSQSSGDPGHGSDTTGTRKKRRSRLHNLVKKMLY